MTLTESDVMAMTMFANSFARGQIPCGSCPVGSDDRIAKARRQGAGHRRGCHELGKAIAEGRGRHIAFPVRTQNPSRVRVCRPHGAGIYRVQ